MRSWHRDVIVPAGPGSVISVSSPLMEDAGQILTKMQMYRGTCQMSSCYTHGWRDWLLAAGILVKTMRHAVLFGMVRRVPITACSKELV